MHSSRNDDAFCRKKSMSRTMLSSTRDSKFNIVPVLEKTTVEPPPPSQAGDIYSIFRARERNIKKKSYGHVAYSPFVEP